jgi:hypothetical protein
MTVEELRRDWYDPNVPELTDEESDGLLGRRSLHKKWGAHIAGSVLLVKRRSARWVRAICAHPPPCSS